MSTSSQSDSAPSSSKKRGRGTTNLKKKMHKTNNKIKFDNLWWANGENATTFNNYLGLLARTKVDINIPDWREVDEDLKKLLWDDVKHQWQIPDDTDDTLKDKVLSSMGSKWRKFKTDLVRKYVRTGKCPLNAYVGILNPDKWNAFIQHQTSEEFKVISEKAKENQVKNEYPHYLGSRGYMGEDFLYRVEEDPLSSLPSFETLGATLSLDDRGRYWATTRMKKLSDGS